MDVVFNCSNMNQSALEGLVNSLSSNSSSDDLSSGDQNKEGNKCSQNYIHKTSVPIIKKRTQRFADSDTDDEDEKLHKNLKTSNAVNNNSDDSEDNKTTVKNNRKQKSRIKAILSSESDEDIEDKVEANLSNNYDLSRVKNKKEKLAAKFNKLVSKQHKYINQETSSAGQSSSEKNASQDSENSDQELNSCNKIKKMFKKKERVQMSSICDPDTSNDEDNMEKNKKSTMKSTKLTSPKPIRISAKQAMENMQKIKSEANRMLREKEVSLPYHKPRALSLKDIMSRRKPALAPDGKTLSVKMTAEQLEQYALQLEQRQKEMMELCKSDDEEEECTENNQDQVINNHDQITNIDKHTLESTSTNDENTTNTNYESVEPLECVQSNVNVENTSDLENVNAVLDNLENKIETVSLTEVNIHEKIVPTNHGNESPSDISKVNVNKENKENDSQMMELHYDSEKRDCCDLSESTAKAETLSIIEQDKTTTSNNIDCIDFPENEFNLDDIEAINENIEISDLGHNKSKQIVENHSITEKPKLFGSPGMVIDLETGDTTEKKLTGVELLKERFQYFAKLKSLEEQEKDREKKYKPGMQHLKLKQELEEQIAEQRSLEWAKRLENENQQLQHDESDNDDIEKIEAKLENLNESILSKNESSESSEEEEEEIEDDCLIEDKPRKRIPMLDDEAEESDIEEEDIKEDDNNLEKATEMDENEDVNTTDEDGDFSSEESDNESSMSDDKMTNGKQRKGRILKAFQDSDDEDNSMITESKNVNENNSSQNSSLKKDLNNSTSQDEELQLAQMIKTSSEDNCTQDIATDVSIQHVEKVVKSQSFSIINSQIDSTLNCLEKLVNDKSTHFDAGFTNKNVFLENFSQNLNSQEPMTESQEIGDDIAALCTGKFYDNPLISQFDDNLQSDDKANSSIDISQTQEIHDIEKGVSLEKEDITLKEDNQALSSILEELNDPDFDKPKQNKYFANDNTKDNKENLLNIANNSGKKKFIIDSDDDIDGAENDGKKNKKRNKKHKKEKKALQFSDDEDDFEEPNEEIESAESDIDDDSQRIVEYDSEENEVVMELPKSKKKRVGDFFEQEAELTSEDEWIGSGDEDEQGLDRMEREEGDNDVFQEDKLRNELGQIHMRDVLDQDKREVRLLQELLFEDGDLGDGHRQRKFRWKNADDADETGAALDDLAETQEEEFESEEQWRKQRHEREVFLRKMKGIDDDDLPNTSINRTTIIKANLCSRTMSSLLDDSSENVAKNPVAEKKSHKDIPSPKKPFPVFQQNYHGSLLSRGKGALARLAAIATPLAADNDDAPKAMAANNRGKFVFAALTPDEIEPKVSKRKADAASASPGNIKKLKTEEKQTHLRSSLFDYL